MAGSTHVLGGFSMDAVRYADGSYDVDRLGGNAFWAALGVRLAGGHPRVHAVVGADYPQDALVRLGAAGMDVGGVVRRPDEPSTRVSFTYSRDGSRTQPAEAALLESVPDPDRQRFIDNTGRADLLLAMLPTADDLDSARGPATEADGEQAWHLGLLPAVRLRELAVKLRGVGYLQLDCPERGELRREGHGVLLEVLPAVDAFLPSTSDAAVFLPGVSPANLLDTFHGWGARAVVLKCGEDGALVSVGGRRWYVPIFRDPGEFDPTGAGDVFGGACATVMAETGVLVSAAVAGATAASFATAARSPLELMHVRPRDYEDRRRFIASRVEEL